MLLQLRPGKRKSKVGSEREKFSLEGVRKKSAKSDASRRHVS